MIDTNILYYMIDEKDRLTKDVKALASRPFRPYHHRPRNNDEYAVDFERQKISILSRTRIRLGVEFLKK